MVRLSGEGVLDRAGSFVSLPESEGGSIEKIEPRRATLVELRVGGEVIDEAILLYFRAPASFTGEDVVELHVHGNPTIVQLLIEEAVESGCRPATPGEFTQRAFLNGRIDLTQVDAIGGLLAAEQREHLRAAAGQLGGSLRERLLRLREEILGLLAGLELGLDFVEEGYEFVDRTAIGTTIREIVAFVEELRRTYRVQGEIGRLPVVCLVGRPNAGKSTLFNALLGFDRSITHHEPGTTRDYVTEVIDTGQHRYRLVDTAGLRTAEDVVESVGIARVAEVVRDADLVLSVVDGSRPDAADVSTDQIASLVTDAPVMSVWTHADQVEERDVDADRLLISALERSDVNRLVDQIDHQLSSRQSHGEALRFIVTQRQEEVLRRLAEGLASPELAALAGTVADPVGSTDEDPVEVDSLLVAEELRRLLPLFGELVGEATNEDVLDRVFGQFCIGK